MPKFCPCAQGSRAPRRSIAAVALTVFGFLASTVAPRDVGAQVRFELPDLTVHAERYTTIDDCLAAVGRVRGSLESHAVVWRDSIPVTPADAREPLAAPVIDTAQRCGRQFTPSATPATEFAPTLQLYLLSGRDADARALISHRLDAVTAANVRARAGVLDTALMEYLGKEVIRSPIEGPGLITQPVRVAAADSVLGLLDHALAEIKDDSLWHHRIAAYDLFMKAARASGDTARAIAAAKHIVSFARTVAAQARLKKDVHDAMRSTSAALELLSWPDLLDSLRRNTTSYVARLQGDWAVASGERPESYSRYRPAGAIAPPIEASFWFRRGDSTSPRPTRGKVALVVFVKQQQCVDFNCFAQYAALHRLAQRFPELEITLVAETQGYLSNMASPPPPEEAETLRHFWLDERQLPGALAVNTTSFWRLPEPDHRRVNRDDPNVKHYTFDLGSLGGPSAGHAFLVDRNGAVVDRFLLAENDGELRFCEIIDAVLAQPASSRTATR